MADFVTERFAPVDAAAELLERPQEKGTDVMRLQAPGLGAFHFVANVADAGRIEAFMNERTILNERPEFVGVEFAVYDLIELGFIGWIVAIANGPDEQVPQRCITVNLAEHVEHGAAEAIALGPKLGKETMPDLAFARFVGHEIPQVADLALANAVKAPEALLNAVRVPRQVVVHHQVRAPVQVDAFPRSIGRHQHQHLRIVLERLLDLPAPLPRRPSVDRNDGALVGAEFMQEQPDVTSSAFPADTLAFSPFQPEAETSADQPHQKEPLDPSIGSQWRILWVRRWSAETANRTKHEELHEQTTMDGPI